MNNRMQSVLVKRFLVFAILSAFSSISLLHANAYVDLPVFYKAPHFTLPTQHDYGDGSTILTVRYGFGNTRKAWDLKEARGPLLSAYGPFNIVKLGTGLEGKRVGSTTEKYWNNLFDQNCDPQELKGVFDTEFKECDGRVNFCGRFDTDEVGIFLRHHVMWGFFVQVYVPYREVKLTCIQHKNLGAKILVKDKFGNDLTDKDGTAVTVNLDDFIDGKNAHDSTMTGDGGLPRILSENDFCIPLKADYRHTGIADILIAGGWAGHKCFESGLMTALGGEVMAGVLAPAAGDRPNNRVFSVPLGYENFWGVRIQMKGYVTVAEKLSVGGHVGINTFFRQNRCFRTTSDICQNGWIMLERVHANVDYGHIWDLAGFVKANRFWRGFSAYAGYSFTKQERTHLRVRDCDFLKSTRRTKLPEKQPNTDPEGRCARIVSQEEIAEQNNFFSIWTQQTLHFGAQYDLGAHQLKYCAPVIGISYDFAHMGKHAWSTEMFSGTLGLTCNWWF
ncbi:MAG: hypothetical protein H6679_05205 [Epsilonproteobacteria bacterium]|nr:hypothetical protein [Campylobacterota bacterium]